MRSSMRRTMGLVALVGALTGCGGPPRAEDTLRALARALRAGDADAAYALMSERYRATVPLEELRAAMARDPDGMARTAAALEAPLGIEEEARAELAPGEVVVLRNEASGWRVLTDVAEYYGRRTPRQTVLSFVRAVEHERFDVVLALLPAAERARLSEASLRTEWTGPAREEVARLIASLREALARPDVALEEHGDRAVLVHGNRFRMVLVREDGLWCIESPE